MQRRGLSGLGWIVAAACAPVALGIATFLDHRNVPREPSSEPQCVEVSVVSPRPEPQRPAPRSEPIATGPVFKYARDFFFVTHDVGDAAYLVLAVQPPPGWAADEPRPMAGAAPDPFEDRVEATLDMSAVPPSLSDWTGRNVEAYGAHGSVCRANVGRLRLVAQLRDETFAEDAAPELRALRATEVWDDGRRLLVARLHPVDEDDCEGATWARLDEGPPPRIYRRGVATPRERAAAHAAFSNAPEGSSFLAEHAAMEQDREDVPSLEASLEVDTWTSHASEERWTSLQAQGHDVYGCGAVSPRWSLVAARSRLDDRPSAGSSHEGHIRSVLDLDRDGQPEMLLGPSDDDSGSTLLSSQQGHWVEIATLPEIPFFGCPC